MEQGHSCVCQVSQIAHIKIPIFTSLLVIADLDHEWHRIRIVLAEMVHFIRQVEAYCQLEVIECSWKVLSEFVQKREGDLDALIEAHRAYLDRMVKKVLLLSSRTGREENLLNQTREIFSLILQFRDATVCMDCGDRSAKASSDSLFCQDDFYNYCLSEMAHRDAQRDQERVRGSAFFSACISLTIQRAL